MGHRPFLIGVESPVPKASAYESPGIIRAAKNDIPAFWFSLFTSADLCNCPVQIPDGQVEMPGFIAERNVAVTRSLSKSDFLFRYFQPTVQIVFSTWKTILNQVSSQYIQLDLSDFVGVLSEEEMKEWLLQCTAAYEHERQEDLLVLFDHISFDYDLDANKVSVNDEEQSEYDLIGFEW